MRITFRLHAVRRMFEGGISSGNVRKVLEDGETIEDYPEDRPYPSRLVFGRAGERPLHVVAAYNALEDEAIVITAYEPDPERWEPDFKRRRKA